nr:TIGR03862 family flavoprotein [Hydromonas duriensis]
MNQQVIVIGAGPAGLMAAEELSARGFSVTVYDAMPSVGRKFLLAGIGGMNITHSEPLDFFLKRYAPCSEVLLDCIRRFDNQAVVNWMTDLGVSSFVGTSGRVFPNEMKAAPLLRAWLARLKAAGVTFKMRHRWQGWDVSGANVFDSPDGCIKVMADATVLSLGGASWPRLGSDASWVPWLKAAVVDIKPFVAANCGFDVSGWSAHLRDKFAGAPIKPVALRVNDAEGEPLFERRGELVLTETGLEGGLIYAASRVLRESLERTGQATVYLDLLPQHDLAQVQREVGHPRGARSMSSHLASRLGLKGVKTALLFEQLQAAQWADALQLAHQIKALPITFTATRPIDEAISSAGGVSFDSLDAHLMLKNCAGVFCAGEMLDWEAPTGGYLLTACFATGRVAGQGAAAWLSSLNK